MNDYFDPTKAVVDIVTSLAAKAADKVAMKGTSFLKGLSVNLRLLTSSHKKYITRVSRDFVKAKSFLNPHTKKALNEFYVPLGISRGNSSYEDATIDNLTYVENANVITGSGGSGKSMMMRFLFIDALRKAEKVPIFVELRSLNDGRTSLFDLVKKTLYESEFAADDVFFKKAMTAGHFAIFLDGYDESDDRIAVSLEIQKLTTTYDRNMYVVSSRPDDIFTSWYAFNEWKIQPLTLTKACELVTKVPAHVLDVKLRDRFLDDLRLKLFKTHESFLSNPLLLSIMILTYRDCADIPARLSVFYDQAYTTLFQRHDALKGGYKRKRKTKLDIQDFARVFSAFSILTFDKRKSSFSETELLSFLKTAKTLVSIPFDEAGFLADAIQAVSLLVRDGMTITFTHRSFQEYFTAQFILQAPDDVKTTLIRKYSKNYFQDAVVQLLHDLDPEMVQREVIIPAITDLEKKIGYDGKKITLKEYAKYIEEAVEEFSVYPISKSQKAVTPTAGNQNDAKGCAWLLRFLHDNYALPFDFLTPLAITPFAEQTVQTLKLTKVQTMTKLAATKITRNQKLLTTLSSGDHILSMKTLKEVIDLKASLVKSHAKMNQSIEKALFG